MQMIKNWIFTVSLFFLAFFAASSLFLFSSETSYLDDEINLAPLRVLETDYSQFSYLVTSNSSGLLGRSVAMASFGTEVILSEFSYKNFKNTNSVIHILNATLVGLFSLIIFYLSGTPPKRCRLMALCVAVFWFLLPIHISTVMYPVQRMAQYSALFVLLGLIAYTYGRILIASSGNVRIGLMCIFLAVAICLPLGLFSKENAILLIPLMFLIEVTFFGSRDSLWGGRFLVIWSVTAIVGVLVLLGFFDEAKEYIFANYRDRTPYQGLLTQTRILFFYLQEIVVPSNSQFGYFHDDIVVSRDILNPVSTMYSVGALFLIIIISLWMIFSKHSVVAFGVLFFFVAHSLESTILPLELYFEHRNYLPSIGVIVALVAIGNFVGRLAKVESLVALFFVGYLAVAGFVFVDRNRIWNDSSVGVVLSEMNHPQSPRAVAAFAIFQANNGFFESALRHLAKVQQLDEELYSAVEIQKIYVKCVNRFPVTKDDIGHFESEFELGLSQYFNHGLAMLAQAVSEDRCYPIDSQVTRLLSEYFMHRQGVPGVTHKSLAEFLLAHNEIDLAIGHLLRAWYSGRLDVKSSLLLFELLVSREEYDKALIMVPKLEAELRAIGVLSWIEIFNQARAHVELVSAES